VNDPEQAAGPADRDPLLETDELRVLGLLPRASNYTFLGQVVDDDRTALVVYKPRDGEMPLWDFPEGTLHRREVAAYVLAKFLGWPSIPYTTLREGPHGPGSVQRFVDADLREHYFTLREHRLPDFMSVAVFDVVANNADRKAGHCLLGNDGSIWLVDHGVCFNVDPKLRTVIWEFAGERLPPTLCGDLDRLRNELTAGPLRERLIELLSENEVTATLGRVERLLRTGTLPTPGHDRAYPWPPV
jgi:hypothetical protein